MPYRDGIHNNKVVQALVPGVKNATANGLDVNLVGFGSCEFIVESGAIAGAGVMDIKLQDAPDSGGSPGTYTDVDESLIQTGLEFASPVTADLVQRVGYIGAQPWVRLVITLASGTSVAMSSVAVLGYPEQRPVL